VLAGILLRTGDGQRAGRLEDRTGVLEDVLDRRADGVGVDQDHFVKIFLAQAEGFLADELDRGAVGEQTDLRQADAMAFFQRLLHGVGVEGLDPDDLDLGTQALDVGGHPGSQPAAADGAEDGVDRAVVARVLAQDFHRHRALAGDHFRIVEGVDEGQLLGLFQFEGVGVGFVVGIAEQHDLAAAPLDGVDLDARRRGRHDDDRPAADLGRRQGHTLGVVACRGADDAALEFFGRKAGDLVVGAAQLEGKHRLHVFALEQDLVADADGKVRRQFERRFNRNVVNLCVENFFQIVGYCVHGVFLPGKRRNLAASSSVCLSGALQGGIRSPRIAGLSKK